jgi:prepilin-type N-terminal cleavage/methylation domain-containing protein/prepilin-type processing-associated H-X9-DG protein
MNRHRGFTLIELLVVIAIIAILASILFPVYSRARAKARQAKCLSNLKQLGLAFKMYIDDFDECIPPHNDNVPPYPAYDWRWDTLPLRLFPYTRSSEITKCPEDREWRPPGTPDVGARWWSYGFNTACGTQGTPYADFQDPSRTIVLLDGEEEDCGIEDDGDRPYDDVHSLKCYRRHNDGFIVLWADGHAKWHKMKTTKPCEFTLQLDCPET